MSSNVVLGVKKEKHLILWNSLDFDCFQICCQNWINCSKSTHVCLCSKLSSVTTDIFTTLQLWLSAYNKSTPLSNLLSVSFHVTFNVQIILLREQWLLSPLHNQRCHLFYFRILWISIINITVWYSAICILLITMWWW